MTKINTNCARHENRRSDEIWANSDEPRYVNI